ncbi:MAG TPA: phasin family protein [Stellaceae bacterium]|nr:phasin family protein [Stellaceae bacterium]
MSEEKEARAKRAAPPANAAAALPEPAPVVALPPPVRRRAAAAGEMLGTACEKMVASLGEAQSALARDVAAMALELNGLARANMTAAGDSALALFAAKSLVDAVEIQLGFARRSLDALAEGSARLGDLGLRLANDAAKPMLAPFTGETRPAI